MNWQPVEKGEVADDRKPGCCNPGPAWLGLSPFSTDGTEKLTNCCNYSSSLRFCQVFSLAVSGQSRHVHEMPNFGLEEEENECKPQPGPPGVNRHSAEAICVPVANRYKRTVVMLHERHRNRDPQSLVG